MLSGLTSSPLFGVTLTVVTYLIAKELYTRKHIVFLNPLIFAPVIVLSLLYVMGIPYGDYAVGGDMVRFLIAPATVALAVPLYKQIPVLRKNLRAVLSGVLVGAFTGVISTVLVIKVLGGSKLVMISLAAKSVTMPIALGITEKLNGVAGLIVFAVAVTGIFGGLIGPEWLKFLRVKSRVATGLAIGTASHAGGTARAVQLGETEGSMSGTAIVLTGLVTALIAPWLVGWLVSW
ncbi:MAG: LrgB family protein [Clostridia bacterium]|nr:LrgB family protein [Clostridia bacterium]